MAPTAAAAATPVVAAAQASAKVTPAVRTSTSSLNFVKGTRTRVTAYFYNPQTGKPVTTGWVRLEGNRSGKWTAWAATKISSKGVATLYAKPLANISFRAVYLGAGNYNVKYSQTYRFSVKKSGSASSAVVSGSGAKVLAEAKKHTGALYKYAASGPSRFDCSGFTQYVYKKAAGKSLPHKANTQQKYGKAVAKSQARVGDLIVFRSGSYGYHAGIYAGGGYMYDSPHTGARVGKHKMYGSNYVVRRLVA
jgi:cell wall-associated NlpC family hydrolase